MLQFVLDTDHLTLFEHGHAPVAKRVAAAPASTVGLTIVTAEEALRGRIASLARAKTGPERVRRYRHFAETLQLIFEFPVAPFDDPAEAVFDSLRRMRLQSGFQDLKIAAIVVSLGCTLVTRNQRDFSGIPGLRLDDWSL
jgi:tRNA(fMet)-specific endonuclease VapC